MTNFDSKTGKNVKNLKIYKKKQNKIFNWSSLYYETHY